MKEANVSNIGKGYDQMFLHFPASYFSLESNACPLQQRAKQ